MDTQQPLTPADPAKLGGYPLVGVLRRDGRSVVYLGRSEAGPVEITLLPADDAGIRHAATALQWITEPAVELAHGAGTDGGRLYVVNEHVEGVTLAEAIRREGPWDAARLHGLAIETASALAALHRAGVPHLAFGPACVVLAAEGPKVIGAGRPMPPAGPGYASPEQEAGHPPGPASDVFSWAVTMIYAATGMPGVGMPASGAPAFGGDPAGVFNAPAGLSRLPAPLRPIVERCLASHPELRSPAQEVLASLQALQGPPAFLPPPPGHVPPPGHGPSSGPVPPSGDFPSPGYAQSPGVYGQASGHAQPSGYGQSSGGYGQALGQGQLPGHSQPSGHAPSPGYGPPPGQFPAGHVPLPAEPGRSRGLTGLIIGVVTALVVVLAGVGVMFLIGQGQEEPVAIASPGETTADPGTTAAPEATAGPKTTESPVSGRFSLAGRWTGSYECGQGETLLTLTVTERSSGKLQAVFAFRGRPGDTGVQAGSFVMSGTLSGRTLRLRGERWIEQPEGYAMVDLRATVTGDRPKVIEGTVMSHGCGDFRIERP